ncbi:TonB-dependent receptor domain-containing protein [Sphingobium tyrosinilyticum]|uniref:TonB-dependent receptor domain-containing protein n=1 Tax=Sphingobium tyrosinilyticum TaxID=2715436 RepID=A0ABV9F405_9SPHN
MTVQPAEAEVRNFAIPAQPAETALTVFAKQSGLQILASKSLLRGKRANAVIGRLEVEVALQRLLSGTGLAARQPADASGIITIRRTQAVPTTQTDMPADRGVSRSPALPDGDIVVTARRQKETSLATPVVLTGISQKEIDRRHLTRLDELNNVVPQLQIGGGAAIQGGGIFLRGVGANANTTTADQGVTFNIDGAQVARSSIRRIGQMDLAQIEVLKGPQALFFGKNSPGGVISMRTADPTDHFEAKASGLYEFNAREAQFDGFVSGPLTDTLGVRVAVLASHMSGWEKNILPPDLPFASPRSRLPHDREVAGRLTLKFDPSEQFDARFKFNYGKLETAGASETRQYSYCPFGIPQLPLGVNGSGENCKVDNKVAYGGYGTSFAALGAGDGNPKVDQKQILSSLEMNYRPSDSLTFTALTSLYTAKIDWVDPYFTTTDPDLIIVGDYHIKLRELSQELRLGSSFAGPVNFLVGGYFQDSQFLYDTRDVGMANNPTNFGSGKLDLDGRHVSLFGQIRVNPVPTVELAGGGRYSWERKTASFSNLVGRTPPADPDRKWTNFSPEFTATWRPSSKLTLFASYKKGFLSGGLSPSGVAYGQQITKGAEAGVKALLFGNRLRANLSAYHYESTGLQVTYVEGIQFLTANAGRGTVKGVEADVNWQTGVEGLTLRAAVGYNKARFDIYTANCYPGQTIAAGCNVGLLPSGAYSLQDLAGRPFANAPDWSGNAGINYERDLNSGWRIGLSTDASYSSSYYTDTSLAPRSKLDGYWMLDANVRLSRSDGKWEAALLARNLTNEHPYQSSFAVLFTGGPSGTAGPTFDADRYAWGVNRGRQLAVQITRRFGAR